MDRCDKAFAEPSRWRASTIPAYLLAGLIAVLAGCIVILASVPPVDRDALTHHLAVPKLYLKHGGMVEIPSVLFSYYPMNLDLLYLIPLYFGNDIIPKYVHFAFALLTAWLIYGYLRRRLEKPFWGLLGALMFLSLPVIVKLSTTVYVDLGLVFFSTASLLYLFKWAATGYPARHLILPGIFCGLALGTKYNALISLLLLASLVPILYVRGEKERSHESSPQGRTEPLRRGGSAGTLRAVLHAVVFVVVALSVYSPWMIRNAVWTGNPLYPLYQGVFSFFQQTPPFAGGDAFASVTADDPNAEEGLNHFIVRRLVFNESLLETLAIPIRIFFQGQDDNPRLFDGKLNPYLFIFPFFAFLLGEKLKKPFEKTERAVLLGFSVLFILFAFFQNDMRIRWVGPAIPPLVILSVLGIQSLSRVIVHNAQKRKAVFAFAAMGTVILGLLAQNLSYVRDQFRLFDPVSYLAGTLSRDQYIQTHRAEYDVIRYANANLPPGEKIFCLFMGRRIYYSDHDMLQGDDLLRAALLRSASAADLSQWLRRMDLKHLLVRVDLFNSFSDGFDPDVRQRLGSFFSSEVEPVYMSHGYGLFKLRESSS